MPAKLLPHYYGLEKIIGALLHLLVNTRQRRKIFFPTTEQVFLYSVLVLRFSKYHLKNHLLLTLLFTVTYFMSFSIIYTPIFWLFSYSLFWNYRSSIFSCYYAGCTYNKCNSFLSISKLYFLPCCLISCLVWCRAVMLQEIERLRQTSNDTHLCKLPPAT